MLPRRSDVVKAPAKAPPDGYTLFFGLSSALASSVTLYPKLPYDPSRTLPRFRGLAWGCTFSCRIPLCRSSPW